MSRSDSVAAVIAAYNARERIAEVITGAFRHVRTVIVADDGSTDGTAQVAKEAGAEVIVLSENRGKGNALRVLFAEARRRGLSAVIALDADGQHDPDDIPPFSEFTATTPTRSSPGRGWGLRTASRATGATRWWWRASSSPWPPISSSRIPNAGSACIRSRRSRRSPSAGSGM